METVKHSMVCLSEVVGIITISMEVELGWGVHDTGEFDHLSEDGYAEREYLTELLSVCKDLQVPISFDVVGHLFLEECAGAHSSPHAKSWFDADPGTDSQMDPLYYAPDMVDAIQAASTNHELCTHTFSHALFNEVSRKVADWELQQVQEVHRNRLGNKTKSLVPPRHQSPPYDILVDNGIEIVRPAMNERAMTYLHRYKCLLSGPLPLSELRITNGIVETYCTTSPSLTAPALPSGQRKAHIAFRHLPLSLRQSLHLRKLKRATKAADKQDGHLHLWCHLYDMSNQSQWDTVRRYLRWLHSYCQNNNVLIETLEELNKRVRNND